MGQTPYPFICGLTAGGALSLAIERKAQGQQRSTQQNLQKRIRSDDLPGATDHGSDRRGVLQDVSNSGSSSLNSSLLPLGLMVAGGGIEPPAPGSEPGELPLLHPAICNTQSGRRQSDPTPLRVVDVLHHAVDIILQEIINGGQLALDAVHHRHEFLQLRPVIFQLFASN